MRSKGSSLPADHRGPFTYSSEVSDTGFKITATYGGEPIAGAPQKLSIDETMQVKSE